MNRKKIFHYSEDEADEIYGDFFSSCTDDEKLYGMEVYEDWGTEENRLTTYYENQDDEIDNSFDYNEGFYLGDIDNADQGWNDGGLSKYMHNQIYTCEAETTKSYVRSKTHRLARKMIERYCFLSRGDTLMYLCNESEVYKMLNQREFERLVFLSFDSEIQSMTTHQFKETYDWLLRCSSSVKADDFNACPNKIHCKNGVIVFDNGEMQIRPRLDNELFTYRINANYLKEKVSSPVFDNYCSTSLDGDELKRKLLLEHLGYILSDSTQAKKILFWVGVPHAGKSVLERLLHSFISRELISSISLEDLNCSFKRGMLFGKKVNISPDASSKALSQVNNLKAAVGNDQIEGSYKHKDSFFFFCRSKFLVSCNTLPTTNEFDSTTSFIDRLSILRFNVSIPPEKQDRNLDEKLKQEMDSIFTLAINAYHNMVNRNHVFTTLEESAALLNGMLLDRPIEEFLDEYIELDDDMKNTYIYRFQLVRQLESFCKKNNYKQIDWIKLKLTIQTKYPNVKYKKMNRYENPFDICSKRINQAGFEGMKFKRKEDYNAY